MFPNIKKDYPNSINLLIDKVLGLVGVSLTLESLENKATPI